jgi:hypothetical protein
MSLSSVNLHLGNGVQAPRSAERTLGERVSFFVFFLFQLFNDFFSFNFKLFYWHCKNYSHLKESANFVIRSVPAFQATPELQGFIDAYKELERVQDPIASINSLLRRGCCHGEATTIVQRILGIQVKVSQVTRNQVLEIFRFVFETHKRRDLLAQVNALLPASKSESDHDGMRVALSPQVTGLQMMRIYTEAESHTVVLHLDHAKNCFTFYNPHVVGGLYEYSSLQEMTEALESCMQQYGPQARCHLTSY